MCSIPGSRVERVRACLAVLREALDEVEQLTTQPWDTGDGGGGGGRGGLAGTGVTADTTGSVDLLDGLLAVSTRAQALTAALVARVDDEGAWHESGLRGVRSWLTGRTTLGSGAVGRLVEQAGVEVVCPLLTRAWRAGLVTWDHVRVVRDAHRRYPRLSAAVRECEQWLVDAAVRVDPATLAHDLFDLLHRLDPDHVTDREHDRSMDATFRASTLLDGWVKVDGLLPPDVGQALCAALAAARQRLGTHDSPTGPDSAAADGAGGDSAGGDGAGRARVRASRRNVDALAVILTSAAGVDGPDRLPSRHGARPVVHVHVTTDSLTTGTAPGWLETATGGHLVPVTAAAASRLACDAVRRVLVTAPNGTVDAISHLNRTVPGIMRRVITHRDNHTCRFTGCHSPIHEVHHVTPWSHGGPTTSSNLVGLCYHHHHLVHDGRWTLTGNANHTLTIHNPHGHTTHSPLPPTPRRC